MAIGCALPPLCEGEPIVTDRPDFTESAETVPRGRVQIEGGYTYTKVEKVEEHAFGEVLARIGATERLEIRLAPNSYIIARDPVGDERGFEDSAVGAKVAILLPDADRSPVVPVAALLLGTSLPTGGNAFREDRLQPEGKLSLAWDLTERLGLGVNVGYAIPSEDGDPYSQASASASLGIGITERLGAYVESFGAIESDRRPDWAFLDGGFTFLLTNDLQLDVCAGTGLNGEDPEFFTAAGFAVRF